MALGWTWSRVVLMAPQMKPFTFLLKPQKVPAGQRAAVVKQRISHGAAAGAGDEFIYEAA